MSLEERFFREPWPEADTFGEALDIQWSLMSPLDWHVHKFAEDPDIESFIAMVYKPTIAYAGYAWVSKAFGSTIGIPSFWTRAVGTAIDTAKAGQALAPYVPAALLLSAYYFIGREVVSLPMKTVRYTQRIGGSSGPYQSFRNPIFSIY